MPFQPRTSRLVSAAAPWGWALSGGLLGLVIVLVLFAPAAWLAAALPAVTQGHIELMDPRGTVWSGSGRLLLAGGSGSRDSTALPGRVTWTLRPAWLGVSVKLHAACCTPSPIQAQLQWRWAKQELRVENLSSEWPAALLTGLGTPWNTLQAQGSLQLSSQDLVLSRFEGRLALSGSVQVRALDMSSRLSTVRPMGSYQLRLLGGPAPSLELSTLSGTLQLSGKGNWVGPRLRFSGVAAVEPELVGAYTNLLNIIGRRQGAQSIITLG